MGGKGRGGGMIKRGDYTIREKARYVRMIHPPPLALTGGGVRGGLAGQGALALFSRLFRHFV